MSYNADISLYNQIELGKWVLDDILHNYITNQFIFHCKCHTIQKVTIWCKVLILSL